MREYQPVRLVSLPVPPPAATPRPVHHAIDLITALSLDIQRLHHRLGQDWWIDPADLAEFAVIGELLDDLGAIVVDLRDCEDRPCSIRYTAPD
jgi:hypothetical protein